ncbi:hypothetical protein [Actinomadura atramentaria]|uniref:hypothetical protein n=1 Tax=Actinomadura atramentaria TaxID=1990 RepID=UPI0012F76BFB|nr:hypothetical protein [Actinomadura atramentaria]
MLLVTPCAGCHIVGVEMKDLPVVDDRVAAAKLNQFFDEVIRGLALPQQHTGRSGSPDSCGNDSDVEYFSNGDYSPYQLVIFSRIEGVPRTDILPALRRLKVFAESSGWAISKFGPSGSKPEINELSGMDPSSGYGFTIDALYEQGAIAFSVGSPCLLDPRDSRAKRGGRSSRGTREQPGAD